MVDDIFRWHTLIKVSETVQHKVQHQYSKICCSLNAINGRKRQLGHPVAKEGCVAPLEENSEAGPDVGNSLPLHLARAVPPKQTILPFAKMDLH